MDFSFKYQPNPFELWKLTMHSIYYSIVGICNIVFTISMILLIYRFWGNVELIGKLLLIAGVSLFTILQPIAIYLKSKKQLEKLPKGMRLNFNHEGLAINEENQSSFIKWNAIKKIVQTKNSLIIFTSNSYGLFLTKNMLGEQKNKLYEYIIEKTNEE